MKSETAKILWALISITIFLITVLGTTLLIFTTPIKNKIEPAIEITKPTNIIEKSDTIKENELTTNDIDQNAISENDISLVVELNKEIEEQNPLEEIKNSDFSINKIGIGGEKAKLLNKKNLLPQTIKKPVVLPKTIDIKPTKKDIKPTKKIVSVSNFWIQVGSYSFHTGAQGAKNDLKEKGFQANIMTKTIDEKLFYRLRVGPFDDKIEADHYLNKMKKLKKYSDSYISKTIVNKTFYE